MENLITYLIIYLIVINLISFLVMYIDKRKAKYGRWRIPEQTLFILALIGGSIGAIAGMYTFRHKTKKLRFFLILHGKTRFSFHKRYNFASVRGMVLLP